MAYMIFGLECDEKTGLLFSSYFRVMGKVMPVVFGEITMPFSGYEKGQLASLERQHQLVNSGNNISFPRIF